MKNSTEDEVMKMIGKAHRCYRLAAEYEAEQRFAEADLELAKTKTILQRTLPGVKSEEELFSLFQTYVEKNNELKKNIEKKMELKLHNSFSRLRGQSSIAIKNSWSEPKSQIKLNESSENNNQNVYEESEETNKPKLVSYKKSETKQRNTEYAYKSLEIKRSKERKPNPFSIGTVDNEFNIVKSNKSSKDLGMIAPQGEKHDQIIPISLPSSPLSSNSSTNSSVMITISKSNLEHLLAKQRLKEEKLIKKLNSRKKNQIPFDDSGEEEVVSKFPNSSINLSPKENDSIYLVKQSLEANLSQNSIQETLSNVTQEKKNTLDNNVIQYFWKDSFFNLITTSNTTVEDILKLICQKTSTNWRRLGMVFIDPTTSEELHLKLSDFVMDYLKKYSVPGKIIVKDLLVDLLQNTNEPVSPRSRNTIELRAKVITKKNATKDLQSVVGLVKQEASRNETKMDKQSLEKRKLIAKEILTVEEHYNDTLNTLVNIFSKPLLQSNLIAPNVHKELFSNCEILLENHLKFLKNLKERVNDWYAEQLIGDLFINETDFLVHYTEYINNYTQSQLTFKEQLKRSEFAKFIKTTETSKCKLMDFSSYMIAPIQHIPRYQLLLKDLVKNTHYNHPDYANLTKSIQKIEAITRWINEQQRNLISIQHILDNLSDKNVKHMNLASRKFIYEGTIQLLWQGKTRNRYLFLFHNLALFCKEKNQKLKMKEQFPITIQTQTQETNQSGLPSFWIITPDNKYLISTLTIQERDTWLSMFHTCNN